MYFEETKIEGLFVLLFSRAYSETTSFKKRVYTNKHDQYLHVLLELIKLPFPESLKTNTVNRSFQYV